MSFESYQRVSGMGAAAPCVDPISCAIAGAVIVGMDLFQLWMHQRQNNAFKVAATTKAESFVRSMYGLDPDCSMPTPGIPIAPGGNHFCPSSVAGMIERCNLQQATGYLGWLTQQMTQLAQQDARYFGAWFQEYGIHDVPYLQSKIVEATALCMSQQPSSPPPSQTGTSISNPGAALGGISTTTWILLGGGLLAVLLLSQ